MKTKGRPRSSNIEDRRKRTSPFTADGKIKYAMHQDRENQKAVDSFFKSWEKRKTTPKGPKKRRKK